MDESDVAGAKKISELTSVRVGDITSDDNISTVTGDERKKSSSPPSGPSGGVVGS